MHRLFFRSRAMLLTVALIVALPWGAAMAQAADPVAAMATPDGSAAKARRAAVKQERDAARTRITAERKAIQQRRSQEETACYQRFAVENCLSEVRTRARLADNALRQQESEINAAERREKSAERLRAVEQKIKEKNQQSAAQPGVEGKVRAPKPAVTPKPPPAAPTAQDLVDAQALRARQARERAQAQSEHQQSHTAEQARKQSAEAERRAASRQRYEEKQREALQNRERQRAKAQESDKPKAAPLPRTPQ